MIYSNPISFDIFSNKSFQYILYSDKNFDSYKKDIMRIIKPNGFLIKPIGSSDDDGTTIN
jgi:hypothetical protein